MADPIPVDAVPDALNNGLVVLTGDSASAGTGQFPSFLQIQNQDEEKAFNTDAGKVLDSGTTATFNHSIKLGTFQVVEHEGESYYVFRLDLNESNGAGAEAISLEDLKIYSSSVNNLTTANFDANTTELYNMDGGDDGRTGGAVDVNEVIALEAWDSGSGRADYRFLIPTSYFSGIDADAYIYLYAKLSDSDGGFEEWAVLSNPTPPPEPHAVLSVDKDTVCVDRDDQDQIVGTHSIENGIVLAGSEIAWVYTVTNTEADTELAGVVLTDDKIGTIRAADGTLGTDVVFAGDTDGDGQVDFGETWTFTLAGVADAIDYTNVATASGTDVESGDAVSPVQDLSGYFGAAPSISVDKQTMGYVNHTTQETGDGKTFIIEKGITWIYKVTNDGNVDLTSVDLVDNQGVTITAVLNSGFNIGDLDQDGILDAAVYDANDVLVTAAETWTYTASATTGVIGPYQNEVNVTANVWWNDTELTEDVCGNSLVAEGSDTSSYTGISGLGLTHGYWMNHIGETKGKNIVGSDWGNPDGSINYTESFQTFFTGKGVSFVEVIDLPGVGDKALTFDLLVEAGKGTKVVESPTLLAAVSATGSGYMVTETDSLGNTDTVGMNLFVREAVTAYLNAVDEKNSPTGEYIYQYSEAEVVTLINDAFDLNNGLTMAEVTQKFIDAHH